MSRNDVYARVTDQIIADLGNGVRPWLKPWSVQHTAGRITRPLRATGEAYRGINVLMLWAASVGSGYVSPIWMTFKQALSLGAHVRKGEHGSTVFYADRITRSETNDAGEDVERQIPFLRSYKVFNVEQIDALPAHYLATPTDPLPIAQRLEQADRFIAHTGATIHHGGNRAFYSITHDRVQSPPFEAFRNAESYYATALHELTHWTRHPSRLNRDLGRKKWGDEGYAREELVAELGAAFVCADLGITGEAREDHAAYIGLWLQELQQDKRWIFTAAGHAQRAADYLHRLQPASSPVGETAMA